MQRSDWEKNIGLVKFSMSPPPPLLGYVNIVMSRNAPPKGSVARHPERRLERRPGARFSKVPKLFGHISGRINLFVCSKRRRLKARNFAVMLIYIPFTTYEKNNFTELAGRSFTNGFSGPKCFRDFRETGPRPQLFKRWIALSTG